MFWFAVILIAVTFWFASWTDKRSKRINEENGISEVGKFGYCGGNDKIIQDCDVWLYWFFRGNFLVIQYKIGVDKIEEIIPYDNIIKISAKTETQIKSDVTLTRLALFGLLAFGMKKEEKKSDYFLVIEYINDEGENQKVILSDVSQSQLNKYNQLLRDYRETKDQNVGAATREVNEMN